MKNRLTQAYHHLKGLGLISNQKDLADKMGYSRTSISKALNGYEDYLTESFMTKLYQTFPTILNDTWLLTGEGPMLNTDIQSNAKAKEIEAYEMIPLIPIRARAGYLAGYGDQEYIDDLPTVPVIVDRTFHGKYRCFEVEGDSMDDGTRDALCDKDVIMGREVKRELWRDKLHYNKWNAFVIVHKSGILIKQIVDHDINTGIITCHSLNNDPSYTDFPINLNEVYELYNVIKLVDRGMN